MKLRSTLLVLIVLVIACGGDGTDDTGSGPDAVELDVPSGDDVLVGVDVELPDWFPPGFGFAEDLSLTQVFTNDQTMGLSGVTDADIDSTHAQAVASLTADGYELLSDNENFAVFVRNGVGRVRVRTSDTFDGDQTEVVVDIDRWTDAQLDELRVLTAPEVTTAGVASADLDGTTFDLVGECIVQGRNLRFFADGGAAGASVNEFADPATIDAFVITDDGFLYFMPVDGDREYTIDSVSPAVYNVSGVVSSSDNPENELELSIDVTCDPAD